MKGAKPLITITQYSMTTARGIILQSSSFSSFEKALQLPVLCASTESIVIENNEAGIDSVFTPDRCDLQRQLVKELNAVFSAEVKSSSVNG